MIFLSEDKGANINKERTRVTMSNIPRIIGLLGRSRVGKDTVAKEIMGLLREVGGSPGGAGVVMRLAKPLKDAACALYGFTEEQIEGDAKEHVDPRYGITPRQAIRGLCKHMMGAHGTDFFTRCLYAKAEAAGVVGEVGARVLIIPDVRYAHDISEIHRRGGVVWKVVRNTGAAGYLPQEGEDHIDALSGDAVIENNGTMADLALAVRRAFHQTEHARILASCDE